MSAARSMSPELRFLAECCRLNFVGPAGGPCPAASGLNWTLFPDLARFHRVQGLAWRGLQQVDDAPSHAIALLAPYARSLAATNLAIARECHVDVVLADFHLHGGPVGLDLLERLYQNGIAGAGALVTANASQALARDARERGFDVLRKPVRPAALRALIAALARRAPISVLC